MEIIIPIEAMYSKILKIKNLRGKLKAWDLSVIFRQIQRHFDSRKDISILDFGAGVSPFGAYLNHFGYKDVTCLVKPRTWHPEINEGTYNKIFNANVKYMNINIVHGYNGEHDVIFSTSTLEHIGPKGRINHTQALSKCLKSGGLFIHVIDYNLGRDLRKLIDNCGVPISYKPDETPGCDKFKKPPGYAWMFDGKSNIAFFNEIEA